MGLVIISDFFFCPLATSFLLPRVLDNPLPSHLATTGRVDNLGYFVAVDINHGVAGTTLQVVQRNR